MVCWLAILLASVCQVKGESFQIKVEVKGIRGETGNVLVMAQQKDNDQPVYGMAKACKGHVVVTLENEYGRKRTTSGRICPEFLYI